MTEPPRIDAFHAHEVLHTAAIITDLFEDRIEMHVFTQADPDLKLAAERLTEQLHEFYQAVGRKTAT